MKQAHQPWRVGIAVLVSGLILGLLAFILIPVVLPGARQDAVEQPPAPKVLAAAAATALPRLDPGAPAPDAAVLKSAMDSAFSAAGPGAHATASVIDVDNGEELYSRSAGEPGIPASSLKVLTAIAAVQEIGEDQRFRTKALLRDADTVVLVGGGDVLLGAGKDSGSVNGHAGLSTLAEQTAVALEQARSSGQAAGSMRVELDESLFAGEALNPAWDPSLVSTHNISPISPLAMYGARANANPKAARVGDPGMYAAKVFTKALRTELAAAGGTVKIAAEPTRTDAHSAGTELAGVSSATLGEQVRFMLEVSDNYVAETLGRMVAVAKQEPADYSHGAQAVAQTLQGLGIDTAGMHLIDTSGLADANRVAPRTLARALEYAATSDHASLRNLSYALPVAGATGTMSTRLTAPGIRGTVRAKTGSLMEVSSLSGLTVSKDGRALAFSFYVHTDDRVIAPHKQVLDAAAAALTGCGCR
ncbi:MAG: D-alanyl-D-alanine carboxypeptidase/D-alanyl-D-alanine-endopeptidase [Micrococcaceae bacterium]|nr:D-alanyl-D-alanine carboxypeptidase/D-alanyl-D-alanine-endopeptidase [Micrococcaceae bacterium]